MGTVIRQMDRRNPNGAYSGVRDGQRNPLPTRFDVFDSASKMLFLSLITLNFFMQAVAA